MNPLDAAKHLTRAVTVPFTYLFVVGLCTFINWFTSPGHWWVQWVAFGMGIALVCIWFRALKIVIASVGLAAAGYFIWRWWCNRNTTGSNAPTAGIPPR